MTMIVGEEVVKHLEAAEQPVQIASQHLGIETHLVVANGGAQATLDAIPEDTGAVYIGWSMASTRKTFPRMQVGE
jgi:cytolysin (calcineurin-like family phosphatase)